MTAEAIVIDTDVASASMRGSLPSALRMRLAESPVYVTFVTVGELIRGATHAGWGAARIAELSTWLRPLGRISADEAVARRWGEITGRALLVGRPLSANDAWIAACCLAHGAELATLNRRDFDRIDGLRLAPVGAGDGA